MQDILSQVSRRAILMAGVSIIAVLVVATVVVLGVLRGDVLDRASWNLEKLARVTGEQMRQSIQSVDIIITATAKDLEARAAGGRKFSDRELFKEMRERVRALPQVRNLSVIDREGNLRITSREFPATGVNLGDREYFRVHRDGAAEALHVGEPVVGRVTGEQVQTFSRPVRGARGEFLGVVLGAMRIPYIEELFAALELGPGAHIVLLHENGVLLLAHPTVGGAVGRSFAEDPLFSQWLPAASSGVGRRAGLLSGEPGVVAYQRLKGYPLVLAVSATEDFILAGWRRDAWRIGAGAGSAAVLLGIALLLVMRQARESAGLRHDLRESGARLQGIIHSAMDAIISVDERQRIVIFNEAAEKLFRLPAADAIGRPLDRFIPERFRAAHRRHVGQFGTTGTTTRMMGQQLELFGLRADGEEFPIDASISQITVDGGKIYTVILRDISERKRAEQDLLRSHQEYRELSLTMNEVREAERTRIARELHDELAQWLTALKMDVSWLAGRLPGDQARLRARTEKMKALVDTTVMSVRRIAADLRPVTLDDLGLVSALENQLHELSQRTGLVVSLDADSDSLDLGEPLATAIYRMVQESLTNVARHAHATEVEVKIGYEGEDLVVTVSDNGRGFDEIAVARKKTYGVLGIRERARTLGGIALIARLATGGTRVTITIPIARFRAGRARA